MKTPVPACLLAFISAAAIAEPIKHKDGTSVEGTILRYQEATIEVQTATGKVTIPVKKLETDFVQKRLKTSYESDLIGQIQALTETTVEASSEKPEAPHEGGKWTYSTKASPIDDSLSLFARLDADSGETTRGETPRLLLRHAEKESDAYINLGQFLGIDSTSVTVRWDKEPARQETWHVSTDRKAAFSPAPRTFIAKAATAEKLTIRITPYSESPVTIEFDVRGLRSAAGPLLSASQLPIKAPAAKQPAAPSSARKETPSRDPMNPDRPSALRTSR